MITKKNVLLLSSVLVALGVGYWIYTAVKEKEHVRQLDSMRTTIVSEIKKARHCTHVSQCVQIVDARGPFNCWVVNKAEVARLKSLFGTYYTYDQSGSITKCHSPNLVCENDECAGEIPADLRI